ncbi:MAG: transporter substrate-binding domain-containing protein [Lachnospiraceae bacterium]|jgi:ABC-type amino acid transport substrate-binding protein|nr:transporter substrate-binding domain-containing protein [Lachnospiraceae bacterium]
MKKILTMMMVLAMMAGLVAGCGSKDQGETGGNGSQAGGSEAVKVIDIDLTDELYAFGVDKDQPELLEAVNAFVAKIKEDGTLDAICEKYFGDGEPQAVQSAQLDPSKDQLVVATNASFEPFEYMDGDNYYGIDMEIAALLAQELNRELVIQNMDFEAVCLSVGQHKCDVAMAGLTVNSEREAYVTFSDSYYSASQRLVVKGDDTKFDGCSDAASVEALLNELTNSDKIGVQGGTTGQFYVEGNEEWEFAGLPATCVPYKNGSLAMQDLINGNIQYVIIDAAPAECIVKAINQMQ